MNKVPDRKKLRQEYLWKKGLAYSILVLRSVVGILGLLFTLWAIALVIYFRSNAEALRPAVDVPEEIALGCGVAAIFAGLFTVVCGWNIPRAYKAIQIPHIPAVVPDLLPAEEVLVRGSEEPPVAQSDILLRASITEQETPPEQLLRPTVEE